MDEIEKTIAQLEDKLSMVSVSRAEPASAGMLENAPESSLVMQLARIRSKLMTLTESVKF